MREISQEEIASKLFDECVRLRSENTEQAAQLKSLSQENEALKGRAAALQDENEKLKAFTDLLFRTWILMVKTFRLDADEHG